MGKVITMMTDWFNQKKTADFLDKLRNKLKGWRIDIIWDRARFHSGSDVRATLNQNRIHEHNISYHHTALK